MRRPALLLALVTASLLCGSSAFAQTVLARVQNGQTSEPIFGALAYLMDGEGRQVRSLLTDALGRALFVGLEEGSYRVRAEMIGMATGGTQLIRVPAGATVPVEIRLESRAIALEGIEVEADGRCRIRPEEGLLIADVWDEARKALTAAAFTDQQDVYRYRTETYERDLERDTKAVLREERSSRVGYMRVPFESRPAEDLIESGFSRMEDEGRMYYAPDAQVLLSDVFLDTHCLRLQEGSGEAEDLIGVAFEPAGGRGRRIVDISGTLWLDPETAELRRLEYRYLNLDPDMTTADVGGRVEFQRLPAGTWIVPEWWIRMPSLAQTTNLDGRRRVFVSGYRQTGGRVLDVRDAGGGSLVQAEAATIEGFVQDSLGMLPLGGVRVGIVGSNREIFTDADGRFRLTDLSEGVYGIRFVDTRLEAWGFVPEPVLREVRRGEVTSVVFRMPPLSDFIFEACRGQPFEEGTATLTGQLRDGRSRQVIAGATVQVRWNRYRMTPRGDGPRQITGADWFGLETITDEGGFYRFCAVPEGELLSLVTVHEKREAAADTLRIEPLARAVLHPLVWRPR